MPFGTINMSVTETAITSDRRTAIWVGLGGSFIQIFQAFLGLKFSALLSKDPFISKIFIWASIPVFIGLGFYFLLKRSKPSKPKTKSSTNAKGFFKGALISVLNFIPIPSFIFLGAYFESLHWFSFSNIYILTFAMGTFLGSFIIFCGYAWLGDRISKKSLRMGKYASYIVAVFMFVLAVVQIVRAF